MRSRLGDLKLRIAAASLFLVCGAGAASAAVTETPIFTFPAGSGGVAADGAEADGDFVVSGGLFYGVALIGGKSALGCSTGCGTAFSVSPGGTFDLLHVFGAKKNDGLEPAAGLVQDGKLFYGATVFGGNVNCGSGSGNGCGTVFSMNSNGAVKILYKFNGEEDGGTDGNEPSSPLLVVGDTLFGVTGEGGMGCGTDGCGTVFSITPDGTETVLYTFKGGDDGANPSGHLIQVGNLIYGETLTGGGSGCNGEGCGTVFSITTTGAEKTVYAFQGGKDGETPDRGLVAVGKTLYGTTFYGGGSGCTSHLGCGTVFSLSTKGKEKVLHSFVGTDGAHPRAGLLNVGGTLYGSAEFGGILSNCNNDGCGSIYSIAPSGSGFATVYNFKGGTDGCFPTGLLTDVAGVFYGSTAQCGNSSANAGTIYKLTLQ
jgi:uncharacterized repeat protein (TIGR03803 family)